MDTMLAQCRPTCVRIHALLLSQRAMTNLVRSLAIMIVKSWLFQGFGILEGSPVLPFWLHHRMDEVLNAAVSLRCGGMLDSDGDALSSSL